jgi:hypothetical protein
MIPLQVKKSRITFGVDSYYWQNSKQEVGQEKMSDIGSSRKFDRSLPEDLSGPCRAPGIFTSSVCLRVDTSRA